MTLAISAETIPLTVTSEGVVRVGRTRVTLDTVVMAFLEGASAEDIQQQYPVLELSDIYSILGYYLRHKAEVDNYLSKRQQHSRSIQEDAERRFNPAGIRARLLSRRKQSD